ncbi:jg18105 [Pararge aegeria aegeria]|uniref:Jg18105 protein n=1 Tax=Pararge aegeria aegeria TaxID=348720 RepID=A0A8S4RPE0_9NEOP|nr:jg18105 [Pararge aegeria aegeria]
MERALIEDISLIKSECDFMLQQMQDLKNQISQVTHQISIIQICSVSEKSKIESHLQNINAHKQGFDAMNARERKISELHNKELEHKQQAEEEIERQKLAKILEMNERKGIQAAAVESECEAIERECNVLTVGILTIM